MIPKLKRIRVASVSELTSWLAKNSDQKQPVMLVTSNKKSHDKYISSAQVRVVVIAQGWITGQSYTLEGNLVGHVISHA